MDPFLQRRIATTSLRVTQLGFGGASLGDMREIIPETQASGSIEAAHAAGIGYFDTSPWYGNGKSELRFGHVLRNKPRDSFVLSTKVGRVHRRPPATAIAIPLGPAACRSSRASTTAAAECSKVTS
jgi:D-threo-aldose 1-dehydrogenase